MECKVIAKMNESISRPFTSLEVEEALKKMAPVKSPNPNGFGACFYQNHWSIVGEKVCQAMLSILNGGTLSQWLIPKVKSHVLVSDYRTISLFSVLYKIMSRVIANKMKIVLDAIISLNQCAFIPWRLTLDNVMVAYEALHTMKTRKKGRTCSMALKLDMSKAYDRIE